MAIFRSTWDGCIPIICSSRKCVNKIFFTFVEYREGVGGSDKVSSNDKNVSDEISMGSFTKFGSP